MRIRIPNAYDSHVHMWGTGQVACGLSLRDLKNVNDVKNLKILDQHKRGDWVIGFGWDQNSWDVREFPTSLELDRIFPDVPVFFSRVDGHSSWINTEAKKRLIDLGINFDLDPIGGKILRNALGKPTGVLQDQAHIQAMMKLPAFTEKQNLHFLKTAQRIFNQGGFTHVRDLSMTLDQWKLLEKMFVDKELSVCVEGFVTIEKLSEIDSILKDLTEMKKSNCPYLRIKGIKLFLDGSLGSKTAYLSEKYLNTSTCGILCWDLKDVEEALKITWQNHFDFAVHTIGDEASFLMVQLARSVSADGVVGRLHLEHVEILRPETVQMMKPLHITCHLQAVHWLNDHKWLAENISESLLKKSFPWSALEKNKIAFDFGSDSPIEPSSLDLSYAAYQQSQKLGWLGFTLPWYSKHTHPDINWTSSYTDVEVDSDHLQIKEVIFDGTILPIKTEA